MDNAPRLVVGASSQAYDGWIQTQQADLDLTCEADWEKQYAPNSVACILAEHVWEHLTISEASRAAAICYRFLKPGGWVRCAVPDGHFPDADYQNMVRVGGPGPSDHPAASHRFVYTSETLSEIFSRAGYETKLLEWWDESGTFHYVPWDERDGFVYRSLRFDHRNRDGHIGFTSLIVDATKPAPTLEDADPKRG